MFKKIFFLIMSMGAVVGGAAADDFKDIPVTVPPTFVELRANAASYTVGQRAILTSYVKILPDDDNFEIFQTARFATTDIQITKISEREATSVTPFFTLPGSYHWDVSVYLRDKKLSKELELTVSFYQSETVRLNDLLTHETDPQKRAALTAEIARDQALIVVAAAELPRHQRLIQTERLTVTVTAVALSANSQTLDTPILDVTANQTTYHVGDIARVTTRVLTPFTGVDGATENVVRSTLNGTRVGVTSTDARTFETVLAPWTTAQIGNHTYNARLYVRSKARSDFLRDAIDKATRRRGDFIEQRDGTEDPMERTYFQREIDDLTQIIGVFYVELENLLLFVGDKNLTLTVTS